MPLLIFVLTGSKIWGCGAKNLAFLQNHWKISQLGKLSHSIKKKITHKGWKYSVKLKKYFFATEPKKLTLNLQQIRGTADTHNLYFNCRGCLCLGTTGSSVVVIKIVLLISLALSITSSFPFWVMTNNGIAVATWTMGFASSLIYLEAQLVTRSEFSRRPWASSLLTPVTCTAIIIRSSPSSASSSLRFFAVIESAVVTATFL